MKQKTTLLLFVFFIVLFSFGQGKEPQDNRHYKKYRVENQIKKMNFGENIFGKASFIIKGKEVFENSKANSTQSISSPSVIKYKLDYEITQNWDETSSQLVDHSKTEYTYDDKGNLTKYHVTHWDGSQWSIGWKVEYSYDSGGNLTQEIESYWDGIQWDPDFKDEYTYDANGNLIQNMEFYWSPSSNQWVASYKQEYTYDTNGNLIQYLEYNWDGSQWVNDVKIDYTYDINGNLIQEIEIRWYSWQYQWVNSDKIEYTYDANNNIIEYIDYNWSSVSNQWNPNYKEEYIYDANGNLIQIKVYDWSASQWINVRKSEYNYDANGDIVQRLGYNWDGSQWIYFYKANFTYNNLYSFSDLILPDIYSNTLINIFFNHMLTNATGYYWDSTLNDWAISENISYSYSEHDILSDSKNNIEQLKFYPNPVSNILTIKSETKPLDKVEIYSVLGKKIKEVNKGFENISTKDLSNGIYLLRIYSEKGTAVKKLIKN